MSTIVMKGTGTKFSLNATDKKFQPKVLIVADHKVKHVNVNRKTNIRFAA